MISLYLVTWSYGSDFFADFYGTYDDFQWKLIYFFFFSCLSDCKDDGLKQNRFSFSVLAYLFINSFQICFRNKVFTLCFTLYYTCSSHLHWFCCMMRTWLSLPFSWCSLSNCYSLPFIVNLNFHFVASCFCWTELQGARIWIVYSFFTVIICKVLSMQVICIEFYMLDLYMVA